MMNGPGASTQNSVGFLALGSLLSSLLGSLGLGLGCFLGSLLGSLGLSSCCCGLLCPCRLLFLPGGGGLSLGGILGFLTGSLSLSLLGSLGFLTGSSLLSFLGSLDFLTGSSSLSCPLCLGFLTGSSSLRPLSGSSSLLLRLGFLASSCGLLFLLRLG